MGVPIGSVVAAGQNFGAGILLRAHQHKRRHPKHPDRVLFPRAMGVLCWVLVLVCGIITAFGWILYDATSDPGDRAQRWALLPFGTLAVALLLMYHNSYVATRRDHVEYRTWLRRVHRIDYAEIASFKIVPSVTGIGNIRVWSVRGRHKYFQVPVFDTRLLITYVLMHQIENRGLRPKWWARFIRRKDD